MTGSQAARLCGGLARLVGVKAAGFAANGALRLAGRGWRPGCSGAAKRRQQQRAYGEPVHRDQAGDAAQNGERDVKKT